MPTPFDFALIALFAVIWPLYSYFIEWPRHLRRVEAGDPDARTYLFARTIVQQWILAGAALSLFALFGRPLVALGLRPTVGWGILLGVGLPLVYATLLVIQLPAVARSAEKRARLRQRIAPVRALVPHTPTEWRLFAALSVTAGICEELLFRGFLVWALTPMLGLWGAAGVSVLVFGLAHMYQGPSFGMRALVAGIGMGLLALATGSIIPGMVLHALIDLGSGYVCYLAMRQPELAAPATA